MAGRRFIGAVIVAVSGYTRHDSGRQRPAAGIPKRHGGGYTIVLARTGSSGTIHRHGRHRTL